MIKVERTWKEADVPSFEAGSHHMPGETENTRTATLETRTATLEIHRVTLRYWRLLVNCGKYIIYMW
jgi:hypothetical protein